MSNDPHAAARAKAAPPPPPGAASWRGECSGRRRSRPARAPMVGGAGGPRSGAAVGPRGRHGAGHDAGGAPRRRGAATLPHRVRPRGRLEHAARGARGAVYLRRRGDSIAALNVVCPHAGCFVNVAADRSSFLCPCHKSSFDLDGAVNDPASPSPRDMDALEVEVRTATRCGCASRTSFRAGPKRNRSLERGGRGGRHERRRPGKRRERARACPPGLAGLAHRGQGAGPRRVGGAHSRRRQVALCVGQHPHAGDRRSVHHGDRALGVVQRQCERRVGERLLHRARHGGRVAASRHPSLHGPRDHDPARPPPHAGGGGRRLQGPARSQLLVRPGPAARRAGSVAHGLPAAVGPEGLLGDQGGHQHRVDHARRRPRVARGAGGGRRIRPPHAHALLRAARGRSSRRADCADRGARPSLPPARGDDGGRTGRPTDGGPREARRMVLARSGPARCRRLSRGDGGRAVPRHPHGRSTAGRPRRRQRALRRGPPRVVLHVPLPVAQVLPGRHRGDRRDRDPGARGHPGRGHAVSWAGGASDTASTSASRRRSWPGSDFSPGRRTPRTDQTRTS